MERQLLYIKKISEGLRIGLEYSGNKDEIDFMKQDFKELGVKEGIGIRRLGGNTWRMRGELDVKVDPIGFLELLKDEMDCWFVFKD
jgi:hypothetical protein